MLVVTTNLYVCDNNIVVSYYVCFLFSVQKENVFGSYVYCNMYMNINFSALHTVCIKSHISRPCAALVVASWPQNLVVYTCNTDHVRTPHQLYPTLAQFCIDCLTTWA